MDQQSQRKVVRDGFTIFRCDDQPSPRIKFKSDIQHDWKTYQKFDSKAARDRAFTELMKEPFAIND